MAATSIRPRRDSPITGRTATWYAKITSRDLEQFQLSAVKVAQELPERADVLEVAPGPGYWAIELAKLGDFRIVGIDLSEDFVRMASANAAAAGVEVKFLHGNAAHMPLPNEAFDFLLCRAAFKNFGDPLGALNEMHRVLRPGGEALIIDLRPDAAASDIRAHVDQMQLGPINSVITKLIFKVLVKRAYNRETFEKFAAASHFRKCDITVDSISHEVRLTKAGQ